MSAKRITHKKLNHKQLLEYCSLHPDDPIFRYRLAEYYLGQGSHIRAIYTARKAHSLYTQEGNKIQPKQILKKFGQFSSSSQRESVVSNDFDRVEREMNLIAKKMHQVKLKDSMPLFKEGDQVDFIYLLISGKLSVVTENKDKHSLLLQLTAGSLVFEYNVFPDYLHPIEEEPIDIEGVDDEPVASKVVYYRGVKTIVEDDAAPKAKSKPKMYRGSVVVEEDASPKRVNKASVNYRGNQVDKSLFANHRYATVVAQKDSVLLKFKPEELDAKLHEYNLYDKFAEEAGIRLKLARLSSSSVFLPLPEELRFLIAKYSDLKVHSEGDTLKKENEFLPSVQLIAQGYVQLYEQGEGGELTYCGRFEKGELMGLDNLISKQASRFIYMAEAGCETLNISLATIKEVASMSKKFKTTLLAYHAQTTTKALRTSTLSENEEDIF